jgi:hypothetical protein
MNCAGDEILRYMFEDLLQSGKYELVKLTTYRPPPSDYVSLLKLADIIFTQNVQNIPHYTFEFIREHKNPAASLHRFAFWRFKGLWPPPHDHFHDSFFFAPENIDPAESPDSSFARYFEESIDEFKQIESESDIKLAPLLQQYWSHENWFSDNWHPSSLFFYYVAKQIRSYLGLPPLRSSLKNNGITRNRKRLISPGYLSLFPHRRAESFFWLDRYVSTQLYLQFQHTCLKMGLRSIEDVSKLDLIWPDYANGNSNKKKSLRKLSCSHSISLLKNQNVFFYDTGLLEHYDQDYVFEYSPLHALSEPYQQSLRAFGQTPENQLEEIECSFSRENGAVVVRLLTGKYAYMGYRLAVQSPLPVDACEVFFGPEYNA